MYCVNKALQTNKKAKSDIFNYIGFHMFIRIPEIEMFLSDIGFI